MTFTITFAHVRFACFMVAGVASNTIAVNMDSWWQHYFFGVGAMLFMWAGRVFPVGDTK